VNACVLYVCRIMGWRYNCDAQCWRERLRSVNVKEVSQHFRAINTYVLYAYCMAITQEEHSSHKIK
jgi:hypothetical protein